MFNFPAKNLMAKRSIWIKYFRLEFAREIFYNTAETVEISLNAKTQ
jgi:hypothetical protein